MINSIKSIRQVYKYSSFIDGADYVNCNLLVLTDRYGVSSSKYFIGAPDLVTGDYYQTEWSSIVCKIEA